MVHLPLPLRDEQRSPVKVTLLNFFVVEIQFFSYYLLTILHLIDRLISRGGSHLNGVEIDPFLVMPTFNRLETYYKRYPKILVLGIPNLTDNL